MASSYEGKGRGRGRAITRPNPSVVEPVATPAITTSADVEPKPPTTVVGRGRGRRNREKMDVEVSNQSQSIVRAIKPETTGTIGEHILVRTNYFPISKFPQKGFVYQYDIEMKNKRNRLIARDHRRAIYDSWVKTLTQRYPNLNPYKIVFDSQKIIFTFDQELPGVDESGIQEKIQGPSQYDGLEQYEVSVKLTGDPIDLSVLSILTDCSQPQNNSRIDLTRLHHVKQVLSVILHEHCSSHADFIFNRSFFSRPVATDRYGNWDLGLGKAVWPGFYSCLVLTKGKHQLLMNLDVSHAVFIKGQPFLDFLCEVMLHSPSGKRRYLNYRNMGKADINDVLDIFTQNNNDDIEFLIKHCRNRAVRSKVTNKMMSYKVSGLDENAVNKTFFWIRKKVQITVKDYYKQQYGIELQYPTLPTLKMTNESFVPMEFIHVQPVKVTKITEEQQAILCQKSSLSPKECYKSIKDIRQNSKQQCFNDPFTTACKMKVGEDMLTVPARVLPMPKITCTENFKVTDQSVSTRGVWNHTREKFYKPAEFPQVWAWINLSTFMKQSACESLYGYLKGIAADRGIQCSEPEIYREYNICDNSKEKIIHAISELLVDNNDCKFLLVILPDDKKIADQLYADIKGLCELEFRFGIITQMIKIRKDEIEKPWNYSRFNNVFRKVNSKLDGINSIVDGPTEITKNFFLRGYRTMYVGVDLSHGAAGSSRLRSTVAVVASVGDIPIRYLKEVYIQDRPPDMRGQSWEYIVDMKAIMKSLISQYNDIEHHPPNAIVIYRDGISTSEFSSIFEKELTATREACVELAATYQPYLTYIVVNKGHHTKFFPTTSNANVEAGTLADTPDITDPILYDFFLTSHYVHEKKGTSRSTHYRILYDDNKLKPDEVHMLTYALCYLHARCSSSISIPAPVKYADLLASRGEIYTRTNAEPIASINQDENIENKIKSTRIPLSPKLKNDCPFFL